MPGIAAALFWKWAAHFQEHLLARAASCQSPDMSGLGAADPVRLAALSRAARLQMEQRAKDLSKDLIEHSTESSTTSDDDIVRLDGWAALLPVGCFCQLTLQPSMHTQLGSASATLQRVGWGLKATLAPSYLTAHVPNKLAPTQRLTQPPSLSSSQEHHTRQAEGARILPQPGREQRSAAHTPTLQYALSH